MEHLIEFRHKLHKNPELSGEEFKTRDLIVERMESFEPDEVVKLGKTGIAFVFRGKKSGPTIMFRAELDALPITEESNVPYRSIVDGVGHLCGHDGHMTILIGLAERIAADRPEHGRIILLFQPAEETGQGAYEVIHSNGFNKIKPDYVFALHNIPGEPLGSVITRKGNFSAASRGLTVVLKGKTAHAAHPELALSPAKAISKMIELVEQVNENTALFKTLSFATVIHARIGEIAFGTTPGYAEIRLTLRSFADKDMERLCKAIEGNLRKITHEEKLELSYTYSEIFPAINNDEKAVDIVEAAADEKRLQLKQNQEPFRWSEDFGYFSQIASAGFFGLGAGRDHAALHHPDYDFPDALLATGIDMFDTIICKILNNR